MSAPANFALTIYRGDSGGWQFVLWNDPEKTDAVDLTGVTPKAEIRNRHGGNRITPLTCTVSPPNIIDMTLSAETSHTLPAGQQVWDLQLTYPGGDVSTVVNGLVVVTADVTDSDPV